MALKRSGFDRPAPRYPSEQLDPPGFDHLLWTWHVKGAKNLDDLPKDLRPKIMGLFSRGDDPLAAFKRARTKPEIEEGEAQPMTLEELEELLKDLVSFLRDDEESGLVSFYDLIRNRPK